MPIQLINTGQTSNDGTGDTLRQGAIKVNQNFTDIYTALGDGTNLTSITGVDTARFADVSGIATNATLFDNCLLYTSPSPRDQRGSRMPSSA